MNNEMAIYCMSRDSPAGNFTQKLNPLGTVTPVSYSDVF